MWLHGCRVLRRQGLFPTASVRSARLLRVYGPGAGSAADGGEAFVVEDVAGDFDFYDVSADHLGGPVDHRVCFVCVVCEVFVDDVDFAALHSLVASEAGDPCAGFV